MHSASGARVGVFDSGVGGLSVLRHIQAQLPRHDVLYCADSAFAPYGEKPESVIVARALAMADFLLGRGAKALVVACNTATVAAVAVIRARYPELPVVGVEPGLKPAAALSKTRTVGVLATDRTLAGDKFRNLLHAVASASGVRFVLQGCTGLASRIETGDLTGPATLALVRQYVAPLLAQGADTLVLGCTHYPFVLQLIEQAVREANVGPVAIIDTGEAIARQLARLLQERDLLAPIDAPAGTVSAFASSAPQSLAAAFSALLGQNVQVGNVLPAI